MRFALAVAAVLAVGCGPQDECSGSASFAICDADHWNGLPSRGTGTRLVQCDNGKPTFTLCANGCVATGSSSDVCR